MSNTLQPAVSLAPRFLAPKWMLGCSGAQSASAGRAGLREDNVRHAARFFYESGIAALAPALYEMNLSDIILTPRYLSKSLSLSGRKAVM